MKKCLFSVFFTFCLLNGFAQMGIGTTAPDSSAMLHVHSDNKGFLPPRIALIGTNAATPVIKPATGLLIYNTATSGAGATGVTPGYYYWDSLSWKAVVVKGNTPGDMLYWNGDRWMVIPAGTDGAVLTMCKGVPTWGGCEKTLSLRPANNQDEAYVYSYFPNSPGRGTSNLPVMAWTHNGSPSVARVYIRFDYQIPPGATILSAKLSLYAASPKPNSGNFVDAHFGYSNSFLIQRVTSYWTGGTITWNSQPSTTDYRQVVMPHTNVSNQDEVDTDVTALVKDMQQFGNNGFMLKLSQEEYYNSRQYFSSYSDSLNKHPKLEIIYKL